ncbi:hypothetical protein VPH35_136815 [Triticum aestivum]|uniref:Uncharacterized protein n=1 Tax=Aegilops tauschii subsp. strangulata TaxID=200361 RepID=A0A453RHF6_AEGTS
MNSQIINLFSFLVMENSSRPCKRHTQTNYWACEGTRREAKQLSRKWHVPLRDFLFEGVFFFLRQLELRILHLLPFCLRKVPLSRFSWENFHLPLLPLHARHWLC